MWTTFWRVVNTTRGHTYSSFDMIVGAIPLWLSQRQGRHRGLPLLNTVHSIRIRAKNVSFLRWQMAISTDIVQARDRIHRATVGVTLRPTTSRLGAFPT